LFHSKSVLVMTLPLQQPFTAIVAGFTGCGKTRFVFRLVENASKMIEPIPDEIVYCYGELQSLFSRRRRGLLIIDDLMLATDDAVVNLFTKGSHHKNVSVLYLTQNLFHKNRHKRTISLNSHYMVLFKNPRDSGRFSILARLRIQVCRRSVQRRRGETVRLSVRGLETSAGRTISLQNELSQAKINTSTSGNRRTTTK